MDGAFFLLLFYSAIHWNILYLHAIIYGMNAIIICTDSRCLTGRYNYKSRENIFCIKYFSYAPLTTPLTVKDDWHFLIIPVSVTVTNWRKRILALNVHRRNRMQLFGMEKPLKQKIKFPIITQIKYYQRTWVAGS